MWLVEGDHQGEKLKNLLLFVSFYAIFDFGAIILRIMNTHKLEENFDSYVLAVMHTYLYLNKIFYFILYMTITPLSFQLADYFR